MRLRAKANGNIIERPDEEAQALLATGIYEEVDADDEPVTEKPRKGTYKRRDMTAEG